MLRYNEVKNDSRLLQVLTSLSTDEFELFLPIFRDTLVSYFGGMWEEEPPTGPGARPKLESAENALFFYSILFQKLPVTKSDRLFIWIKSK